MNKKPLIVVTGPTASGKTELAIKIAESLRTEIISADSMQIYKGIEIISAAPDENDKKRVKHHLVSFKELGDEYSVSDFIEDASDIIDNMGDKVPVVCGGTGLYLSSLINNIDFSEDSHDESLRLKLIEEMNEKGAEYMHRRLGELDSEAADSIHPNNRVRVIRAIEIITLTGKSFSEYKAEARKNSGKYDYIILALNYRNRELLYDRINKRVDSMLQKGMLDEAKHALSKNPSKTALSAIGLKEFKSYFSGDVSFEEAIEKIKQGTRNYAKRQITWIKKMPNVNWLYLEDFDSSDDIAEHSLKLIKERFTVEKK